jgi:hypothetical protein
MVKIHTQIKNIFFKIKESETIINKIHMPAYTLQDVAIFSKNKHNFLLKKYQFFTVYHDYEKKQNIIKLFDPPIIFENMEA